MEALGARETADSPGPRSSPRRWRTVLLLLVAVGAIALTLWLVARDGTHLDPNKVVVFPLTERGPKMRAGTGQEIALMIGSALEHTEPLQWIDGWTWLNPAQRADIGLVGAAEAGAIARRRSARYFVDGAVVAAGDSARVILRLNDARGDSMVSQVTAEGLSDPDSVPQLGLRAINLLLPRLLEPGRRLNLTALAERRPAAIALWLQGEKAYRGSRFATALDYQRRAVESDSALAFAALKGALAAEWEHQYEEAADLVELALRNDSVLPAKYVLFAQGLRDYYAGRADSATAHVEQALLMDSTWSEGWMALGEIRYHLLPDAEAPAAEAFERARAADPEFAPPLFHLAEIALREGDTSAARVLIGQFRRADPDSLWLTELYLTLDCLRGGPQKVRGPRRPRTTRCEVVQAARVLASPRGASRLCGSRIPFRPRLARRPR